MSTETDAVLEAMIVGMTDKQQAFLRARLGTKTDADAMALADCSRMAISRWKNTDRFAEVYNYIAERARQVLPALSNEDRVAMVAEQFTRLTAVLGDVVKENIRIALEGKSERDKLVAIKLIYDTLGLQADKMSPMDSLSKIAQQIVNFQRETIQVVADGVRGMNSVMLVLPEAEDVNEPPVTIDGRTRTLQEAALDEGDDE